MSIMTESLKRLREEGGKLTDKRENMLEILCEENRYLTARDMHQRMQSLFPTISFDTIYRNLNLFTEIGIVEETEWNGERVYRIQCELDHHHHHFICSKCGKTKELADCPMDFYQDALPGYKIESHRFEIFGLCAECAASCE